MTARKQPPPPKKASGRNVEEWERGTVQVKLRLKQETVDLLYSLATEMGGSGRNLSLTVTAALQALSRELDSETRANG